MKRVSDVLTDGAETFELKNKDYGESWKNIGHILYKLANEQPVVLESPEDWIAAGLFTRRLDKFARSFNGEFLTNELNFESAIDADEDESVYAAMQAVNKIDRRYRMETPIVVDPEAEQFWMHEGAENDE